MNCAEVRTAVDWLPGGRVPPERAAHAIAHTMGCSACRARLVEGWVAAEQVRAAAAGPGPSAAMRAGLMRSACSAARPARRPSVLRGGLPRPALRPFLPPMALMAFGPLRLLVAWRGGAAPG